VIHPWNGKEITHTANALHPEAALSRQQLAGIQPRACAAGSVTLWLSDEVAQGWRAQGGKGCVYSDVAIRCGLSLRTMFNLTLRQTQGFLASLATKLLPGLPVPHYSTFCRRAAGLALPQPKRRPGAIHLVIDSTGLKVFGEGEWKVRQHGYSKRRQWCKLHLAVDQATGEILAPQADRQRCKRRPGSARTAGNDRRAA